MQKLLDRVREESGVYSLGFNHSSFVGIMLPILFVILVGGGVAAWIILK